MTQFRKNPEALSNYFDRLLSGIGHRGSSFTGIDFLDVEERVVMTHDKNDQRFIVQEFKRENEKVPRGQELALSGLARLPQFTVWLVVKRNDGLLDWYDYKWSEAAEFETITEAEYRSRFERWWNASSMVAA